jgi:membrane protein implicated in regulation of membrane protease activity
MNLFNRIFTIVSLVLIAILGAATFVIPDRMLLFVSGSADFIHTSLLGGMTDAARLGIRVVAALILLVVVFFLLWLETRRGSSRHVEVAKATGGQIRITTRDVEARIQQQVDAVSGIITSRVRVNEHDRAVVARLDVEAAPGVDLVAKGEEVAAVTRIAVQDQLGLKLFGKPQITLKSSKMKPVAVAPVSAATGANSSNPSNDKHE